MVAVVVVAVLMVVAVAVAVAAAAAAVVGIVWRQHQGRLAVEDGAAPSASITPKKKTSLQNHQRSGAVASVLGS